MLPDEHRKAKARSAAHKYAPKPEGSSLTYGVVGVVLALLAIVVFGIFYGVDVLSNPIIIGVILVVVFAFSVLLRKRRRRVHGEAYRQEYERHDNSPPND